MPLSPGFRERALTRMADEVFDVVVIGGGITGVGAALDAAARGLSVALVERGDFASGTSSRSSNLIHGGLRYLERLRFGFVREALREQTLLLSRLCPHLLRPVPFLYPLRSGAWERLYVGAGLMLYDAVAGRRAVPRHRYLRQESALEHVPALRAGSLIGAVRFWDARTDDARLTVTVARTAAAHGAAMASGVEVLGFLRSGRRISGVRAVDLEGRTEVDIRARVVINAAGVWADDIEAMVVARPLDLRVSKGVHLVVPRDRIEARAGLICRTERSVLLVIPWGRQWIIGTTDTGWDLDKSHPVATRTDTQYLLDRMNEVLTSSLGHEDVQGVYVGLRPLIAGRFDGTSDLSRRHRVTRPTDGLVTVAGGKLTIYRAMAEDVVDAAGNDIGERIPRSHTDSIPLIGAEGYPQAWHQRHGLAVRSGLSLSWIEHLLRRYGSRTDELLALIADRPELGEPLEAADGYLGAEVVYGASREGATHLEDVLARRTRISLETRDRGIAAARQVAGLMAGVLDWDEQKIEEEIRNYSAAIAAERGSERLTDDASALAVRTSAPDARMGDMGSLA